MSLDLEVLRRCLIVRLKAEMSHFSTKNILATSGQQMLPKSAWTDLLENANNSMLATFSNFDVRVPCFDNGF